MNNTANIHVVQGDILARTFTFTDTDTGDPYDLSIYTEVKMQIRKKPGTILIAEGSLTDGQFAITGDDNNVLEMDGITIPEDTTAGVYMYDIEFSATDIRETLIRGRIIVQEQITAS